MSKNVKERATLLIEREGEEEKDVGVLLMFLSRAGVRFSTI